MKPNYDEFSNEETDRKTNRSALELSKKKDVVPIKEYSVYPSFILDIMGPNFVKNKKETNNYFEFSGLTISDFCQEYMSRIFAKPLRNELECDLLNEKQKEIYTFFKEDFLFDDFEEVEPEIKVSLENLKTKLIEIKTEDIVNSFDISPDGSLIIYHDFDKIKLYDLQKQKQLPGFNECQHSREILCVKYRQKTNKIYSLCSQELRIFNSTTGKMLKSIQTPDLTTDFSQFSLTKNESEAQIGTVDGKILVYNLEKAEKIREIEGHRDKILFLDVLSKDNDILISSSLDNTIRIWEIESKKEKNRLKQHTDEISGVAIAPNSEFLVSSSFDGRIIKWNIEEGEAILTLTNKDEEAIESLAMFPCGNKVITGSSQGLIIWDLQIGNVIFRLEGFDEAFLSPLKLVSDGSKLVFGVDGDDTGVWVWNFDSYEKNQVVFEEKEAQLQENSSVDAAIKRFNLATLTPNGNYLAIMGAMNEVELWDLKGNVKKTLVVKGQSLEISTITCTNDSKFIVISDKKHMVRFYDVQTLKETKSLNCKEKDMKKEDNFSQIVISKDNRLLCYFSSGCFAIWEIETKEKKSRYDENIGLDYFCANDDFSLILAATDLYSIYCFTKQNLENVYWYFDYHERKIDLVSISPDNKIAVSLSKEQKIVCFWDLDNMILIRTLEMTLENRSLVYFTVKGEQLLAVNNFVIDYNNQIVLSKYHSFSNLSRNFYCTENNFILSMSVNAENGLKVEKIRNYFSEDILANYFLLNKFFINNEDQCFDENKEIYKGNVLLYPFRFNFLHLIAITQNKVPCKIDDDIQNLEVPMNALLTRDCFGNNCFDILMMNQNRELLRNFLNLYMKVYDNESTSFFYKILLFKNDYHKCKNNKLTTYDFFKNLMNLYGDTVALGQFLEKSFMDYQFYGNDLMMDEFDEPIFLISNDFKEFANLDILKERIRAIQGSKKRWLLKNEKKPAIVHCKVLCLEHFVDLTEESMQLQQEITKFGVSNAIFSNKALEVVVNYKWKAYARSYFLSNFKLFLIFLCIFLVDFMYVFPNRVMEGSDEIGTFGIISCILDSLNIMFFVYYSALEIRELKADPKDYLSSGFNYIDICLILCSLITLSLDILEIFGGIGINDIIKLFSSMAIFLYWTRLISYLRGFEGTAFMIRLIIEVIFDIRYFLILILLFTLSFNCALYVIQSSFNDSDTNYINFFDMFTLCYRLLLGDYTNYDNLEVEFSYYVWFLMIIFTLLLTVILLNLLISIIGNTFNTVFSSKNSTRTYELIKLMSEVNGIDDQAKENCEQLREQKILGKYFFCFYNDVNEEKIIEQNEFMKTMLENNKIYNEKLEDIQDKIEENSSNLEKKFEKIENELASNSVEMAKINKVVKEILNYLKMPSEDVKNRKVSKNFKN